MRIGLMWARLSNSRIELKIGGMHCKGCTKSIERFLKLIEGVVEVDVNFSESKAELEVVPGRVSLKRLEEVIEMAGYRVVK
ncbi:MAG: heavy-metal-associated domain-containing protein [Nitrososphaerales archaeon]